VLTLRRPTELLVNCLAMAAVAVLIAACTARTDGDVPPAATAGSTALTSAGPSSSASGEPTLPDSAPGPVIPTTPIKHVIADQVVHAWTAKWHPSFETAQSEVQRERRTTVDYPAGAGTLTLGVAQSATGKDPAAEVVYCVLRDPSLGDRNVKATPTLLHGLVRDCFAPVLNSAEANQVSSWAGAQKLDRSVTVEKDFPGFHVQIMSMPGVLAIFLRGR
jgi:hypothetical protein